MTLCRPLNPTILITFRCCCNFKTRSAILISNPDTFPVGNTPAGLHRQISHMIRFNDSTETRERERRRARIVLFLFALRKKEIDVGFKRDLCLRSFVVRVRTRLR